MTDESGRVRALVVRVAPNCVHDAALGIYCPFPTADRSLRLCKEQFDDCLEFLGRKVAGCAPVQFSEGGIDGSREAKAGSQSGRGIGRFACGAADDPVDLTPEYCWQSLCSCTSNGG